MIVKSRDLQVILDREIIGDRDIFGIAKRILEGGAPCIQLRDKISSDKVFLKEAGDLRKTTKDCGCVLIINDRVDIAMAVEADGVHLGQDDLPYEDARSLLGSDKIIGISTHNIEEALKAQRGGADYIGVGPIFPTQTKPDLEVIGLDIVSLISSKIKIPAFFIGGISLININEIIERGGRNIAVASAILNSNDIIETTTTFLDRLRN